MLADPKIRNWLGKHWNSIFLLVTSAISIFITVAMIGCGNNKNFHEGHINNKELINVARLIPKNNNYYVELNSHNPDRAKFVAESFLRIQLFAIFADILRVYFFTTPRTNSSTYGWRNTNL